MPYCCVPGCTNKSSDLRCIDTTFHRLPLNNKDLLNIWINNLNLREQTNIPDHYRVCSDHFDVNSFRQSPWASKRCLLPGSIPNKFDQLNVDSIRDNLEGKLNIEKLIC